MYRGYLKWFTEPPEQPIALPDRVHVYWPAPFTYRPYGYDYGPPSGRVVQLELKRDAEQRSGYRVNHVNEGACAEFGNLPSRLQRSPPGWRGPTTSNTTGRT